MTVSEIDFKFNLSNLYNYHICKLYAILQATLYAKSSKKSKFIIRTDSESVTEAIKSMNSSDHIYHQIQETL